MAATFEQDTTKRILTLENRVERLISQDGPGIDLISPFLDLPGLVGFWPMSSIQRSTGNVYDLSGQNRTLTYQGTGTRYNYTGLVPFVSFNGSGYLERADETDLDITGAETIFDQVGGVYRWGLTIGGWFYFPSVPAATYGLFAKFNTTNKNRSYGLFTNASGGVQINCSSLGTTTDMLVASAAITTGWHLIIGNYTPITSVDITVDGVTVSNATSIASSLYASTASLYVATYAGAAANWTGYASSLFLCANSLSDAIRSNLYQRTRGLFGV